MTTIKITEIGSDQISALLAVDNDQFAIPLKIKGMGLARFKEQNNEKRIAINPDIIHISKNKKLVSSIKDVKLTRIFGKTLLEGITTEKPHSPVVVDLSEIKEMWTDSYSLRCDIWNIEV